MKTLPFSPGDYVQVKLSTYQMRSRKLMSRELDGRIMSVKPTSICLYGASSTLPTEYCHRCGRHIEVDISRTVGYGPHCSKVLGIDRSITDAEIAAHRERIARDTVGQWWFATSYCEVRLLTEDEIKLIDPRITRSCEDCLMSLPTDFTGSTCRGCLNERKIGREEFLRRLEIHLAKRQVTRREGVYQTAWLDLRAKEETETIGAR